MVVSVGICKYKLGYKSYDQLYSSGFSQLKLQHSDWRAQLAKDFSLNKFPTNAMHKSTQNYNRSCEL